MTGTADNEDAIATYHQVLALDSHVDAAASRTVPPV